MSKNYTKTGVIIGAIIGAIASAVLAFCNLSLAFQPGSPGYLRNPGHADQ